jgi:glycosyltransferase involved in cell wall biosynthesis
MKKHIGYFVPEFPGQTHIFFWREVSVLEAMGVQVDILSTRIPPARTMSHTWTKVAQQRSIYLVPFTRQTLWGSLIELLRSGPQGWLACLRVIFKAKDVDLKGRLRLLMLILVGAEVAYLAQERGWQHLHVHSCADAANIALFASKLSGLPYSMTLHGPALEVYGPNQAQKWENAAFAIVVSQKLIAEAKHQLPHHLPNRIVFAPMGVNVEQVQRHQPYIPWEPGQVCRIFACGRLNPMKGHEYLIQAVGELRQQGIDAYLQIAGEDKEGGVGYRPVIERFIAEHDAAGFVELLGAVSEDRVRQALETSHVFALASLNEGIPVAVMEAMAMGIPVVVTDVGGNAELIDHNQDALLVPAQDVEALTTAIASVLHNPELARQLSQSSRQKIVSQFHHHRSAETLVQCLEKCDSAMPSRLLLPLVEN